jgi:hypothetical protein
MYSLLLSVFFAARMFTESLPSNNDIPLLLLKRPIYHNMTHLVWVSSTDTLPKKAKKTEVHALIPPSHIEVLSLQMS